jgi:TPR repeat protein
MHHTEFHLQPFAFFYKEAQNGNLLARACLGRNYIHGLGVKKNHRYGYYWIRMSGRESAMSLILLGFCHQNGIGVQRDMFTAIDYYRRAKTYSSKMILDSLFLMNDTA